MAGTKQGGLNAARTNRRKFGADFYARIGALGGSNGKTGGFASELVGADGLTGRERARIAGQKGGSVSRRSKSSSAVDFQLHYEDLTYPTNTRDK